LTAIEIDPSARVHAEARIGERCRIAAHCVIGPGVSLGPDNEIGEGCVLMGNCRIGAGNTIGPECRLGSARYELATTAYDCGIEIGDANETHACVTISRGTPPGPGLTRLGDGNVVMPAVHIGPDCRLGDFVVLGEDTVLQECVRVDSHAVIGAETDVHGFVHIGSFACVGSKLAFNVDIPPFVRFEGDPPAFVGLCEQSVAEQGFSEASILQLREVFAELFDGTEIRPEIVAKLRALESPSAEVRELLEFLGVETDGRG